MDAERRYYSIGEMCEAFGVTARALRFYEDEKLIAPERRGTTRLYTDRDRGRLELDPARQVGRVQPRRHPRIARPLRCRRPAAHADAGDPRPLPGADRRSPPPEARHRRHHRRTPGVLSGFSTNALIKRKVDDADLHRTGSRHALHPRGCAGNRPLLEPAGLRQRDAGPGQAILEEGGRFCEEVLQPLNRVGDEEGCKRNDDGSVTTPPGFKEAWDQFVANGWTTLSAPEEYGGQGMPHVVSTAISEYPLLGQPQLRNVQRPDPGRDRRAAGQGHRRAEGEISAEHGRRPLDRHDEPDRAALRHRPRPAEDHAPTRTRTAAIR